MAAENSVCEQFEKHSTEKKKWTKAVSRISFVGMSSGATVELCFKLEAGLELINMLPNFAQIP